jgi:hypothetical protein
MTTKSGYGIISYLFTDEEISEVEIESIINFKTGKETYNFMEGDVYDPNDKVVKNNLGVVVYTLKTREEIHVGCKPIGEKCDKTSNLAKRNSVICSLKKGAKKKNVDAPEINICTECKEEEDMSEVTDPEIRSSIGSELDTPYRDTLYGNEHRPSISSLDTNTTPLTDEESQAYEKFKEAVCKASNVSLEETEVKFKKHKAESDRALKNKDDEIKLLQSDLNKQGRRVIPNIFSRSKYKNENENKNKKGGKKKSSTKKKRKNATRRKKKYGKKSKKSRK